MNTNTITPAIATTESELVNCINENDKIIYIKGHLFHTLVNVLRTEPAPMFYPTQWLLEDYAHIYPWESAKMASAISSMLYKIYVNNKNYISNQKLPIYNIGFDGTKDKQPCDRIILVHKNYSFIEDSVADDIILTDNFFHCPKCDTEPQLFYCPKCKKRIVFVRNIDNISKLQADGVNF